MHHFFKISFGSNVVLSALVATIGATGLSGCGKNGLFSSKNIDSNIEQGAAQTNAQSVALAAASPTPTPVEILSDVTFSNGITMDNSSSFNTPTGETKILYGHECPVYIVTSEQSRYNLYFGSTTSTPTPTPTQAPKWTMAQWGSQLALAANTGAHFEGNNGTFQWINNFKRLMLGKVGSGYGYITFGVNGSAEYNNSWATASGDICVEKSHPHMLLGQVPQNKVALNTLNKLNFSLSTKITKLNLAADKVAEWNKNIATAHVSFVISAQNLKLLPGQNGRGQSFGVMAAIFDARNRDSDYTPNRTFWIHRPQQRILELPATSALSATLRNNLHSGMWGGIDNADLLPFLKSAFNDATTQGNIPNSLVQRLVIQEGVIVKDSDGIPVDSSLTYTASTHTCAKTGVAPIACHALSYDQALGYYSVSAVNILMEVSSLHDIEMQINKLGLTGIPK